MRPARTSLASTLILPLTRTLTLTLLLLVALTVPLTLPSSAWAQSKKLPPSPTDPAWLLKIIGDGAVAYQCQPRGAKELSIYLIELRDVGNPIDLGHGHSPEFSPDSSRLAWVRGNEAVGRVRAGAGDGELHVIASDIDPQGGVHWIANDSVVVKFKEGGWHRVTLAGKKQPIPALEKVAFTGRETDVRLGKDGVWSFVAGQKWVTSDGKTGRIPGNCSSSLSPDGRSVGALQSGHKEARYAAIREGGSTGKLEWKYASPKKDKGFDNHRWSSNDARFFIASDEAHEQPVILMIGSPTRVLRLGKAPESQEDVYADMTVGKATKVAWSTTSTANTNTEIAAANTDSTDAKPHQDEPEAKVASVTLTATLREKALVPDPGSYPHALVVYRYEVTKVVAGNWPAETKQVFIAHWVIRDRKVIAPIANRKVGSSHTMTLESLDAHPDATSQHISLPETEEVLGAVLWLDMPKK